MVAFSGSSAEELVLGAVREEEGFRDLNQDSSPVAGSAGLRA